MMHRLLIAIPIFISLPMSTQAYDLVKMLESQEELRSLTAAAGGDYTIASYKIKERKEKLRYARQDYNRFVGIHNKGLVRLNDKLNYLRRDIQRSYRRMAEEERKALNSYRNWSRQCQNERWACRNAQAGKKRLESLRSYLGYDINKRYQEAAEKIKKKHLSNSYSRLKQE